MVLASSTMRVLLNNGAGNFQFGISDSLDSGFHFAAVSLGDCNGDGFIDAVLSSGEKLGVRYGVGDGTFGSLQLIAEFSAAPMSAPGGLSAVVIDIDGDNDLDIAWGNSTHSFMDLYENDGVGGFVRAIRFDTWGIENAAMGDLDGDGLPELLGVNDSLSVLSIHQNYGGFDFARGFDSQGHNNIVLIDLGATTPSSVSMADFDSDGDLDAFVNGSRGTLSRIYENQGGAGIDHLRLELPTNSVDFADLNGDGLVDIFEWQFTGAFNTTGTTHCTTLLNQGAFSFSADEHLEILNNVGSIGLADFNADGKTDLVASGYEDGASILLRECGSGLCAADMDGSGTLDFFDVSGFLGFYQLGDLAADFTGDGELNFFDVSAFLNAFNAGCP